MKSNNLLVIGKDNDGIPRLIESMFMVEGNPLEIDDDIIVFNPDGFDFKIVYVRYKSKEVLKSKVDLINIVFKRMTINVIWNCIDDSYTQKEVNWLYSLIKHNWAKSHVIQVNIIESNEKELDVEGKADINVDLYKYIFDDFELDPRCFNHLYFATVTYSRANN